MSDLTPEEALRRKIHETVAADLATVCRNARVTKLDENDASYIASGVLSVALAAVAAERERTLAAVRAHLSPGDFTGLDAEAIRRQLGAREGDTTGSDE